MNILYLTQFFSGSRGGAPLLFFDFAKSFAQRGNNIHIICNVTTEQELTNIHIHKVKPHLPDSNQVPTTILPNLQYITSALIRGISIIDKYEIDIVHTNSLIPVIVGGILGKLKGVPVVASIHDVFTGDNSSRWKKWLEVNRLPNYYHIFGELMERVSLSMPKDVIHTLSQSSYNDIHNIKPNAKIKVIPPSVNPLNYPSNAPTIYENFILFIGRLVFYKNIDVLLKAFQTVVKDFANYQLIIAGDGPMKSTWQSLASKLGIEKNVLFIGNISNEQKIDLLNRCLALALPSTFEGFGLVILESFMFKKPVLVSDVSPFDEIIDHEHDGFLIPSHDSEIWAKRIIDLIKDRNLVVRIGRNGYSKYEDKFNFSNYISRMENLYKSLIR
jgi:glycosyltransferase involved in cell wall biosynthesis